MAEARDSKTRQYVVIDPWENVWGPFESSVSAAAWIHEKWPDRVATMEEDSIRELCAPDGDYPVR